MKKEENDAVDTCKITNEPVIRLVEIKKSFGKNIVLNGITADVCKGDSLAVLGRSGSGKSVLIKIISGLLPADSGEIEVLGKEIAKTSKKELQALRQKIGFSFQSSALYDSMSVSENLAFPLTRNKRNLSTQQVKTAIESVLNDVGLPETVNRMPADLSGGQRKRIGIARTLIMQPEIMLYDEPTAGLDPVTCIEVNNLIVKVQKQYNASSIIITHDLTCAKTTANKVTMIIDGRFSNIGKFEEIFNEENEATKAFYDYNFINQK
jgi:phospholipid/cholesterol/gamma-HCH transport system ATP-binding protein